MATTQDERLLSISTPLGKDYLMVQRFECEEGISRLFEIHADLVHEEGAAGYSPTVVPPGSILGKNVSIYIEANDGTKREFSGMVSEFAQGSRDVRFSYYQATIVPHVWLLTQKSQSRIFQQKSVPDILRKVLEGFQIKWELQETYEPRNYCVQYRETDFDFISRLMEEEGIYYYFDHSGGDHSMIIADTPQSHRECPTRSSIPFFIKVGEQQDFVSSIGTFWSESHVRTGKVALWDYNFELPTNRLNLEKTSRFSFGDSQKLELYDYPGGYARKYDGIDKAGGEQSGELQKVFSDRERTVTRLMESMDSRVKTTSASGDCCSITAGFRFKLTDHPDQEVNGNYTVTWARHRAEQNPAYVSDEALPDPYTNNFLCMPHGSGAPAFRPLRSTPKPAIQGSQTAVVVGPGGEEIFTDKYGRVKVQFNWDREGKVNESSSCWIRVAQMWAGNTWGTMFIPRVGMEVVVSFLEGDPDQPIITGCVYNPQAMPPYKLPDEKTKSTIKTNSSKGGGGFNELRFEDKKGSEQIFIHAQKDEDIRVRNDCKEIIGNERHLIVESKQFEKIKADKHLTVVGDHKEKINGSMSLTVGMDQDNKVGMNYALQAGMGVHIKAGMSAVIEAGVALTLKVGGNFINISPAGVVVSGTMVMINSGGAAGSGSGCNPENPIDPKEAVTAEAGKAIAQKPSPPPPSPFTATRLSATSGPGSHTGTGGQVGQIPPRQSLALTPTYNGHPMAKILGDAANNATPFCEICNGG